jgi:sirohydrochlorin cobaltochelatase
VSELSLEQLLEAELTAGEFRIGEVVVSHRARAAFEITHRSTGVPPAEEFASEDAVAIAKFDNAGNYRPLRTAPNLRDGWKIRASNISEVVEVIDAIYPARLATWRAWKLGSLTTTPLRETLNRQGGMYRVAAKISDEQINDLMGNFCRSDGGCLRTILWQRDQLGHVASDKLPPQKFDPASDQAGGGEKCIPLLCQEACNLLVAACREVVKAEKTPSVRTDASG